MNRYENTKKKKKSNTALKIIISIFVTICAVSSFILVSHVLKDRKAEHDFTKLQVGGNHNLVALHKKNHDLVGWIKVKGTRIDYPVMQTLNDPEFYLRRNFQKNIPLPERPSLMLPVM